MYHVLHHMKSVTEQIDGVLSKAETNLRQVILEATQ